MQISPWAVGRRVQFLYKLNNAAPAANIKPNITRAHTRIIYVYSKQKRSSIIFARRRMDEVLFKGSLTWDFHLMVLKKSVSPCPWTPCWSHLNFFAKIAGVNDTGDEHKIANISANFCIKKNTKYAPTGYSGTRGQLIPEKTRSRKSRVRLPLKPFDVQKAWQSWRPSSVPPRPSRSSAP